MARPNFPDAAMCAAIGDVADAVCRVICPTSRTREFLSTLASKNISVFQKVESGVWSARPASMRGAYRDRHETWSGMRWTRRHHQTNDANADGEAVWFWHPLAGVKFADRCFSRRAGDGD